MSKIKKRKVGDVIQVGYLCDAAGQWWWAQRYTATAHGPLHGPFCTSAEAEKNSEIVTLGPQCKVINTRQSWDTAWERKQ